MHIMGAVVARWLNKTRKKKRYNRKKGNSKS